MPPVRGTPSSSTRKRAESIRPEGAVAKKRPPARPEDKLAFSISQFAELCDLSQSKMYDLIQRGLGPPVTEVDGRRIIRRADGERWLAALPTRDDAAKAVASSP